MKRNIFDEKITMWSSAKRSGANNKTITVREFLQLGQAYLHRPTAATDIARLRALYDEAIQVYEQDPARAAQLFGQYSQQKTLMPLATMGGTFSGGGKLEDMATASDVLCVDVDAVKPTNFYRYAGKEIPNSHVRDWNLLKRQLAQIPFVAYASLSIGGHGLFLLIPVADHHRHNEYWTALEYLFLKHLGLTIDANTKDITRPRFVSYDPEPYVNQNAEVFDAILQKRTPPTAPRYTRTAPASSTEEAVRKCVEEIERKRLDITSIYDEWADIAAALYNGLGEAGKQFFERVSAFYPQATDKDICLKWEQNKNRQQIGIGTFFHLCSRHGIIYKQSPSLPLTHAQSAPSNDHARHKSDEQAHTHVSGTISGVFCHVAPIAPYSALEDITQEQWDSLLSPETVQRFRGH